MTANDVVIVGAGLAGAKTAEALRTLGHSGGITLVGDERHLPYERPALSKEGLIDGPVADRTQVHSGDWYADHDVELITGYPVTDLDIRGRRVSLTGGVLLRYRSLVLTTGAAARQLRLPGAHLRGVHQLRTIEDSTALYAALARRPRAVVIGGGWVGLEVAAAARAHGAQVTVLEQALVPLERVLGTRMAEVLLRAHRDQGVQIRAGVDVRALVPNGSGRVAAVLLGDGSLVEADLVVVGIGAQPRSELAQRAGLGVSNGIDVDANLRTSAPDVYAAGDVANAWHPTLGRHLRVEHWDNALHQPETVAASVLGIDAPYERLPYFFSDQYDLGLEYTGWMDPAASHEVVVRGDERSDRFTAFWLREGRLAAGLAVNEWGQMDAVQGLIRSGAVLDLSLLRNPDVPLPDLLAPVQT